MHAPSHRLWRSYLSRSATDPRLRTWLTDSGSLTARLQGKGAFSLRLLRQGRQIPLHDEADMFGLHVRSPVFTREVILHVNDAPQVFARTILPFAPRSRLSRRLVRLGTRSLGSLLFSHPGFVRHDLRFISLDPRRPLYPRAALALKIPYGIRLPARRSVFLYGREGRAAVLVTEVFSPGLSTL